jgi:uncharacterized protein
MPLQHHPLSREFPELKDALRRLVSEDGHFARLVEEYEELDKRIYEVESGRVAMDELMLAGLKMQRVGLKDELADKMRAAG